MSHELDETKNNTGMEQANAAQVLMGFIWNDKFPFPKEVLTISTKRDTIEIEQDVLLSYLMKFQQWLYEHQPKDEELISKP